MFEHLAGQAPAIALGAVAAIPTGLVMSLIFKLHWPSWFGACLGIAAIYLGLSSITTDPAHPSAFMWASVRWFAFALLIFSFVQFRRSRRALRS
jgi:Gpi18-like mannosyltransferase